MAVYKDSSRKTWYVDLRYRDINGEIKSHKKRGFFTKKSAEAWENSIRFDESRKQEMIFEEVMEQYFNSPLELPTRLQFVIKGIYLLKTLVRF